MAGFQEKPKSAPAKANQVCGESREIRIERHEKEADLRKMVSRYQKTVNAEVIERTEECVKVRYKIADAEAYQKACRDKANRLAKVPAAIRPENQYAGISSVAKNDVESADIKDLMGQLG